MTPETALALPVVAEQHPVDVVDHPGIARCPAVAAACKRFVHVVVGGGSASSDVMMSDPHLLRVPRPIRASLGGLAEIDDGFLLVPFA